jgi:hypothetical protein
MLNVKTTANPMPFVPSTGYNVSTHGSDSTPARDKQQEGVRRELTHILTDREELEI